MKNIALEISFDGSNFHGFQIQPDARTIQGELEKALKEITKEDINLISCGRTDAGVHANYHVSNFLTELDMPAIAYKHKLDMLLPEDILVINSKEVDTEFNSRYDAKSKTYVYKIYNDKYMYPYLRDYMLHIKYNLDLDEMRKASKLLEGVHDFTPFMKLGQDKDPIRSLDSINISKQNNLIEIEFKAQSFLHNQIRIMVGLLIDIGRGFRKADYVNEIFEKNIKRAAKTYGPQGLYLTEVIY